MAQVPDSAHFSFAEALKSFLARLPVRSRQILEARFSMVRGKPTTLQAIGRTYSITRERVRQIIGAALGYLSQEKDPLMKDISERIESALRGRSGIMASVELLEKLAGKSGSTEREKGALLAFLACLPAIREENATKEHVKLYRLADFRMTDWRRTKDQAQAILAERKKVMEEREFFELFQKENPKLRQQEFVDFLSVSQEVQKNVFGKWGLSTWSDIKPRGTREKAHLVLKTAAKPLHFRKIAENIDSYGLQGKKGKSHPQTVHNELIKDDRFVLVGRGIYALKSWGYERGTVKEVLENILRAAARELSREEILKEVMKVRQVKKSTVIINLNTFFYRVGKDAYTIKK